MHLGWALLKRVTLLLNKGNLDKNTKRREPHEGTQTSREEHHRKTRDSNWSERSHKSSNVKDYHQKQTSLPIREFMLCQHYHFRCLASRIVRKYTSVDSSHLVGGLRYGSPRKLMQPLKMCMFSLLHQG